jgi:hypothetical protein
MSSGYLALELWKRGKYNEEGVILVMDRHNLLLIILEK